MSELFEPVDDWDRRLALSATGLLAELNQRGLFIAADVHVATRIALLGGEADPEVLLAIALTTRALRQGSVCLDLEDVVLPPAMADLSLPDPGGWADAVRASPLHGSALRLEGSLLYLARYWQQEGEVVDDLLGRVAAGPPDIDETRLRDGLDRLFAGPSYAEQRAAAEGSARRLFSVITGGPGTGKTTTLARLLVVLSEAAGSQPRIALAAPTGKAAARMTQALAAAAAGDDFTDADRQLVLGLEASTLHRLLGTRPDNATRFRHHRDNPLPHDVVVVDETSMVSLTMMARLLEAVRPEARIVLVGDADQLASVEAGAVLQDLVTGFADSARSPVSTLATSHRYGDDIGALADAVRDNRPDEVWLALTAGSAGGPIELIDPQNHERIRAVLAPPAIRLRDAARTGDPQSALAALAAHRLLCAHREGPAGVVAWNRQIERWLQNDEGRDWLPHRYAGQPLIVNANDYGLRLWNGDTGVVIGEEGGPLTAIFDDGAQGRPLALARLSEVETAHALTVHRSQGSQFVEVTVLLPEPGSQLLSRALFYTALTRAQDKVRVIATREAVEEAVATPARRASGLARRLAAHHPPPR